MLECVIQVCWIKKGPEQRGVAWKVERACAKPEREREIIGCKHALTVKPQPVTAQNTRERETTGDLLHTATFLPAVVFECR